MGGGLFYLHPWKLTCPQKRDYFSREYIFQPLIFRGHVSFQGSSTIGKLSSVWNVYESVVQLQDYETKYYRIWRTCVQIGLCTKFVTNLAKSGWFNAALAKYHIGLISTLYVPGSKLLTLGMIILPVIGILIMEIYLPGLITICYKPLLNYACGRCLQGKDVDIPIMHYVCRRNTTNPANDIGVSPAQQWANFKVIQPIVTMWYDVGYLPVTWQWNISPFYLCRKYHVVHFPLLSYFTGG